MNQTLILCITLIVGLSIIALLIRDVRKTKRAARKMEAHNAKLMRQIDQVNEGLKAIQADLKAKIDAQEARKKRLTDED
jgi:predicted Holliday junction resolvase-like endonuclease